jgi:hypothetical protein
VLGDLRMNCDACLYRLPLPGREAAGRRGAGAAHPPGRRTVTRVYLEVGAKSVFACAVDWPGWCRAGRTEEAALEGLLAYAPRYARWPGPSFDPGELVVVGRLPGTATTDFGAPDARGAWDDEPLTGQEADRQAALLEASWAALDRGRGRGPRRLAQGPARGRA